MVIVGAVFVLRRRMVIEGARGGRHFGGARRPSHRGKGARRNVVLGVAQVVAVEMRYRKGGSRGFWRGAGWQGTNAALIVALHTSVVSILFGGCRVIPGIPGNIVFPNLANHLEPHL